MFFMSTWWGDSKNMQEIEFSQWLFELPAKWHSQFSPSGSIFLHRLSLPSKSHRENSISSIFLESCHQVNMRNVVKSSKHFFGYFNTQEIHSAKSRLLPKIMNSITAFLYDSIKKRRKKSHRLPKGEWNIFLFRLLTDLKKNI